MVYLLVHDDRMYDMGDSYVRGVYASRETAEADIVTRTASGNRSTAWDAHNESCCGVQDWEVQTERAPDIKEDAAPFDPSGERLVSDEMAEALLAPLFKPTPYHK